MQTKRPRSKFRSKLCSAGDTTICSFGKSSADVILQAITAKYCFRNLYFYFLNGSEVDHAKSDQNVLLYSQPSAKVYVSKEGEPVSFESEHAVNITEWPKVKFPVPHNLPTTIAYSTDHPFHRLDIDRDDGESVSNVSFAYTQMTPAASGGPVHDGTSMALVPPDHLARILSTLQAPTTAWLS